MFSRQVLEVTVLWYIERKCRILVSQGLITSQLFSKPSALVLRWHLFLSSLFSLSVFVFENCSNFRGQSQWLTSALSKWFLLHRRFSLASILAQKFIWFGDTCLTTSEVRWPNPAKVLVAQWRKRRDGVTKVLPGTEKVFSVFPSPVAKQISLHLFSYVYV